MGESLSRNVFISLLFLAFGTHSIAANPNLVQVNGSDLPKVSWGGNLDDFKTAIERQLKVCGNPQPKNVSSTWELGNKTVGPDDYCKKTLTKILELARKVNTIADLDISLRSDFEWYKAVGSPRATSVKLPPLDPSIPFARASSDDNGILYTGYYSPHYAGSLKKTADAIFPVYTKPVSGKSPKPIAYLKDPFDAYLLGIQGSGYVDYTDANGKPATLSLQYAGSNGKSAVLLGRILRARGVAEKYLTVIGMRAYYKLNPNELESDLKQNTSVIYFAKGKPMGAVGAYVTPQHSVAVSPSFYRLGALAVVATSKPVDTDLTELEPKWDGFMQPVITQDVGGAINGAGHVDFYWGEDEYAEYSASLSKQDGELYFALAK